MPADKVWEGFWDCDACGHAGIGGLDDECPNCGQRRPKGVEFYLTDEAKEITDPDLIKKAESGGDWRCKYCGFHNRAYQPECKSCGAVIEDDVDRIPVGEFIPTEQLIRRSSDNQAGEPSFSDSSSDELDYGYAQDFSSSYQYDYNNAKRPSLTRSSPNGRDAWKRWFGVALAALLLIASSWGVYESFIKTHDVSAHVNGFSWNRQIEVEVFGTVREEGWSIPSGGREVSSEQRFHHNDRVFSHNETRTRQVPYTTSRMESYSCTRDNGNGTFSSSTCTRSVSETNYRTETYQEAIYKDVPVNETWYTYDIDKWHYSHTEKTSGQDRKPYWPKVVVHETQREGRRTEKYTLTFVDANGREFKSDTDYDTWLAATDNQEVVLKLNRQNHLRDFELVS